MNGTIARVACLPGSGLVGYATSRKLGGKPQRNRQRRRLCAAVHECRELILPTLDYVLIVGPSCADADFGRIKVEAHDLLLRANARWADESVSS